MATTTAPFQLDVSTPSLGVRLWIEAGKVCLHVGNDSGRGAPCAMLVLPVTSTDPLTLIPAIDLAAAYASDRLDFYRRTDRVQLPSPYTERYDAVEWLARGPHSPARLVVLMFHQGPLTSGIAFPPSDEIVKRKSRVDDELRLIESLFAPKTRNPQWLQRGLVYLDPANLPGMRQSKGPPPAFDPTTFVVASCQYPAGLLDGTPPAAPPGRCGPADASMLRLAERLQVEPDPNNRSERPSLLVLAGDQVYVDATAGLFDPRARVAPTASAARGSREIENWLRIPYENWLGSAGALAVLGSAPTLMMLDDHEISDNWEPLPPPADPQADADNEARKSAGAAAYVRYQRNDVGAKGLPTLWHMREHRGLRFFMGDTRTERQARKASFDPLVPRIMSPRQTMALTEWLRCEHSQPSFVVTPSMLLPRLRSSARSPRGALHSDGWCGYPGSLHALLALLCREQISNVVFLSGDAHLSFVARATVCDSTGRSIVLHSVHSSALYAPYPFANAIEADFEVPDAWCFDDPCEANLTYRVTVDVAPDAWAPGDGFACLRVTPRDPTGWQVAVTFDRDPQRHPHQAARAPIVITL